MVNKKLYDVTIEFRVLVYAENAEDAEDEAERSLRYERCEPHTSDAREIKSLSEVDKDWRDSIPCGENDRTIAQIWEEKMGKQPEQTRADLESAGQERLFS